MGVGVTPVRVPRSARRNMNEREWMLFKASQLEACFVIRQAQVTARWAIATANAVISQARQRHITFKGKKDGS